MKCAICKQGELHPGPATVTLTKDGLTRVVKEVPALVCGNCGEEYVDKETTARLLKTATDAARAGVEVDVRTYTAAA